MINSGLPLERYILPIAIGGAGLVLAWLAKQPSGLLVPVAALIILGGRQASLLSAGFFALALAAFILAVGWDSVVQPEANLRLAVLLAVGLGISGLIYLNQTVGSVGHDENEACMILENMWAFAWSADPNGKVIYVNPSMLKYLGQPAEGLDRIEGTDDFGWRQFVHPDDYDQAVARWLHSLKTGEPYNNEHRIRRVDGVYRWFRNNGTPSRDSRGCITGWYGTTFLIDDQVTSQEALRQSERRYRDLFHYMPIGLAQVDASKLIPIFNELRAQGVADLKTYIDEHPEFLPRAVEALEVEEANQHIIEMFGASNAQEMGGPITRYWQPGIPTIRRSIEARYRGQEVVQEETKVARMDGSVIDVLFTTARPGALADKSLVGFIDITERKKAEQALRDREQELSQLVDMVPSHVWRLTPDGEPTFYNKRLVDFLGLDVGAMDKPGMSRLAAAIAALVHPDDRASLAEALSHSLTTGERFSMRYRQRRADGLYRWLESRAEPLRDDSGAILEWYGTNVDIDDLVRAHSAIAEREARIRRLIDSDIIGIAIWDLDGTLIDANDAFLHMLQYEREDLEAGLRWFNMTPPDWQEVHAREEAAELAATGKMQAREKEFFRKDGSRVPVLIGGACFEGQSRQGVAYILDLTERYCAAAALRDRERELSQLVNMVPCNVWRLTPDGAPTFFNKRTVDFLGLDVADMDKPGMSRLARFIEAVHPDDATGFGDALRRCLATGESFAMRYRVRRADGVYRWREGRAEPMRDEEGGIVQWYGVSHDIDDQMRAEEALRRSERELQQLVDALSVHIWSWTPDGRLAYVNKRSLEDLGLSGANFEDITRVAQELVHPEDAPKVLRRSVHCLKTGESFLMRYRRRWKDGNYRWIEARCEPLRDRDGTISRWYQVSIDIDGEVRAQEALRLAGEKMALASQAASLAELSASIAHEVNQPLAAIVATSHACRRWLSASPPNLERAAITLERIIRDANSASEVVSRIRALFSQMGKARSTADLGGVITEVCRLMADELAAKNIRMKTDLDHSLPPVLVDRIQIQQVLVNLIRNAIDSMDTAVDDARLIRLRTVLDGDNAIRIEVQDLGAGMKEPERAFEPFFTTKEGGMGMGLAICRSIIEAHDGRLWATNNEPRGTTLAFTLPIQARDAA